MCGMQYSSLLKLSQVMVFHGDNTEVKLTPFIENLRSKSKIIIKLLQDDHTCSKLKIYYLYLTTTIKLSY